MNKSRHIHKNTLLSTINNYNSNNNNTSNININININKQTSR
jgi:hypothetical protein